jgi:hypothetical protein
MALTKLPKNAIADGAVKDNNIADGTVQAQDVTGPIGNEKLANSSFTLNGTEVSLGASQSVITYLDWQSVQVADGSTQVNAESGKGYFLDTNVGVIEVFLPTSPSRGDVVGLVDYAGTFGTNQLIINTGGVNIDSTVGSEFKVTTNNAIVECVYVDAAKGWLVYLNQAAGTTPSGVLTGGVYDTDPTFIEATGGTVSTSGDYKIHTFTGDGCFVVSQLGSGVPQSTSVDYVVVAGGGAAGSYGGGGGGAGGFREGYNPGSYTASPLATSALPVSATTYPITIGGGGAGVVFPARSGNDGSNSVFSTITSTGGGGGGGGTGNGGPGGSGAGGGGTAAGTSNAGTGNTPPVSPSQGNPGGNAGNTPGTASGGGGGGATAAGEVSSFPKAGDGGAGATTSITGTPTAYAGGGGGGGYCGYPTPGGAGGTGGGGTGTLTTSLNPVNNATANTGGGGAGNYNGTSGSGGKGIVIIRYKFQ